MMPLSFSNAGDNVMITRIGGNMEAKKHLEDLGFVVGERIRVISATGNGNVIVNVKDARLAITDQMAAKIMVQ
ncbi:MAG: ferrous iron transport protein A [Lachnospiraceae bacterium]|nr:ferrous iron transport protein A [Lachnospiraceae bacterium]MBQ2576294.1 ferrous iron transport protein A [Lachnospiraceae bacterium]MBQ5430246.1 ferrous iron transport protein A [Lachnospiraceae bacterium]MCR4731802.1 ferrous iron transport protein A [Lachnospiraceae bacterium]MEE3355369.1 FeoA family protein [Candidatus Weimeria sp.]